MNIHFTARQTDLAPEIKQYCEKKLKALEKVTGGILEVDIILSEEKSRKKAEIHVIAKGSSLVVIEETADMLSSLNLAFDNLEKKIKKEREKFRERKRRKGRLRKTLSLPAEAEEPEKKIIRSAHYSLKPMPVEEAVMQLEMRKKEVFVFRKEDSEKWAVLYRRKDGHIGLVEPE